MTRRRVAALLAAVVALLRTCASVPAIAAPCTSSTPLHAGEVAACDGLLWPSSYVVEALRCVRVDLPSCKADAARDAAICAADRRAADERVSAAQDLASERLRLLDEALALPPPAPQWSPPAWLLVSGGAALGATIVGGLWYVTR